MKRGAFCVLAAVAVIGLSGCMSSGPRQQLTDLGEPQLTWVRTDGMSGRDNPRLLDQFNADAAACRAAGNNAALHRAEACMRKRGYVLVPAADAEATAKSFHRQAAAR